MKKMELQIALTFAIMFVVGVIIGGIYSVISMNSNFFTFEVMTAAMTYALIYLMYIWINTRKHPLLAGIGVIGILSLVIFASLSSKGVAASFNVWGWKDTVMLIYNLVALGMSEYQGRKLLEEESLNIRITITEEDIDPDNVGVKTD